MERVELSRSDKEAVYLVKLDDGTARLEIDTPDGKTQSYQDYVSAQPVPKEPTILKPHLKWYQHPAPWAAGGAIVAIVLSHFWK